MEKDLYDRLNNHDQKLDLLLFAAGYEYDDEKGFIIPEQPEKKGAKK